MFLEYLLKQVSSHTRVSNWTRVKREPFTKKKCTEEEIYLVKVHELHLVVRDFLLVGTLEHEGHCVGLILSLHRDDVIIGSAPRVESCKIHKYEDTATDSPNFYQPQDLGHAGEVHAHAEGPVATELVKAVGSQVDGHQGHMGVVHGLSRNS